MIATATAIGGVVIRPADLQALGAAGLTAPARPRVSIIVAATDAEASLPDSLASLARQTMAAWEAIVVDDGSTDRTVALAESHAAYDTRIRIVRQHRRGASVARNRGVTAASAEWLVFLDPGDELAPNALERLLRVADRDPTISVIHGGWTQHARDGTRIAEGGPQAAGDLFDRLARESAFPVHACMVRRVLVQAAGGWDTTLSFGEDWDLWQRVARMGVRFGVTHAQIAVSWTRGRRAPACPSRMLTDGIRVVRRGHAPDPRVCSPSPRHVEGRSADPTPDLYHFACWCAGRLLATGGDASATLDAIDDARLPTLDADLVAAAILRGARAAAPELATRPHSLRVRLRPRLDSFLDALARRAGAPRLAAATRTAIDLLLITEERLARGFRA